MLNNVDKTISKHPYKSESTLNRAFIESSSECSRLLDQLNKENDQEIIERVRENLLKLERKCAEQEKTIEEQNNKIALLKNTEKPLQVDESEKEIKQEHSLVKSIVSDLETLQEAQKTANKKINKLERQNEKLERQNEKLEERVAEIDQLLKPLLKQKNVLDLIIAKKVGRGLDNNDYDKTKSESHAEQYKKFVLGGSGNEISK